MEDNRIEPHEREREGEGKDDKKIKNGSGLTCSFQRRQQVHASIDAYFVLHSVLDRLT